MRNCAALVGALLVAMSLHAQSYVFSTLAGQAGIAGSVDGVGSAARFDRPFDIAVDAAGNLYVADINTSTIRKISPSGVVSTLAGRAGVAGDTDGPGDVAQFNNPEAIAVDAAGNVFVADTDNNLIRKVSPAGFVTTVAGRRRTPGIYAEGAASSLSVSAPRGVGVDTAGNLYLTQGAVVQKISPTGLVTTLADPKAGLSYLGKVVVDAFGNLFVVDLGGHLIRKIAPDGTITTFGSLGASGLADGVGAAARFGYIIALTIDRAGTLFITEGFVLRKMLSSGEVTTIAGRLTTTGILGDSVDGPGAYALFGPSGVTVDPAGNLYLADGYYHTIRKAVPSNAPAAPIITSNPYGQNYNVGEHATVTFTAPVAGSAPFTYQWAKNDVAIVGATGATLTLPDVTPAAAGSYRVTVTNVAGSQTAQIGTLAVYVAPIGAFTSRHARGGGSFLWSIASGGGSLVAVGTDGTILSSADGQTWTNRVSNTSDWLVGVTYGAGKFVAVGDHGRILVSTDGVTWTNAAASGTTQRLNNVIFAAGRFVAVGEGGAIVTSTDAQTWTPRSSGVAGWLRGLAYTASLAGGYFAACGQGGAIIVSSDSENWLRPTFSLPVGTSGGDRTSDLEAMMPSSTQPGLMTCIGQNGAVTEIYQSIFYVGPYHNERSVIRVEWYLGFGSTGKPARIRGLAIGAGALFATGENGAILAAPSRSGPWAVAPAGTTANLVSGIFQGNTLYIVGENETILSSAPLYTSRLINIATRGRVGVDANAMFSGFVVSGTAPKQILLRAAGPALATFGVGTLLAEPVLTLFDSAGHALGTNTGWDTVANSAAVAAAAARVGAFPFAARSADSALLVTLPPGAYTAQITGRNRTTGESLVEAYDAEPLSNEGSRAINISTRGQIGGGADKLIAGFVIGGAAARRVLIRAVGPSLVPFGLAGAVAQPQIQLWNRNGTMIQPAGAWNSQSNVAEIRDAALRAGAFPLMENSRDSAIVVELLPGQWTVHVNSADGGTGLALVEVYDLP